MSTLISGSCLIQAAMLRVGFGLVFVGLVGATQAAQSDEDFFVPKHNLLTTRLVHSSTDFLPPYQFSASVVLTRLPDTAPIGFGVGSAFQLSSAAKPKQETAKATNALWQQAYDDGHISLPRLLSVELKEERVNTTFRPRSILIEGERLKITFRPQSALIEREVFKIMLQPHSVSVLWSNVF